MGEREAGIQEIDLIERNVYLVSNILYDKSLLIQGFYLLK
jgi:hypothetical protein